MRGILLSILLSVATAPSALHQAAERGDAAEVGRILKAGMDANERGERGITPLHLVMAGAYKDAMNRSMAPRDQREKWSVAKARTRERETRGQAAKFVEVTRLLLARGADANAATVDGATPLHIAAQARNPELVGLLIAAKADMNAMHRRRNEVARTPLVDAVSGGEVDCVRALLDAGADLAKVPEETQPYFATAAMSDIEVFRLLLDRGMKLSDRALRTASRNGNTEAVAEIIRRQMATDLDAALYAAAQTKQDGWTAEKEARLTETVKMLLKAGASPSAPDGSGEALVAALVEDHAAIVQLLREGGAKVNWARLKDDEHHPPTLAYFAVIMNRVDRLREFEKLGMPLDGLGAAILGRAERLREVIANGQANVAGERGSTALYFAAAYGNIECVRVLLDAKTDPNARLPSWDTPNIGPRPLEGAAERGHEAIVRLLLERGADPKLVDLDDEDLAHVRPEIRALLRPATTKSSTRETTGSDVR